jgi:hypothetical protein
MLVRINQALYPKGLTPPIIASTTSRHETYLLNDATARYLKVVDADLEDKTIAFAEWHVFATPEEEGKRLDLAPKKWPSDVNLPLATEYWGHIADARRSMAGKAHVCESCIPVLDFM